MTPYYGTFALVGGILVVILYALLYWRNLFKITKATSEVPKDFLPPTLAKLGIRRFVSADQQEVLNALAMLDVFDLQRALDHFRIPIGWAETIVNALEQNHSISVRIPFTGGNSWLDIVPYPGNGHITVTWVTDIPNPPQGLWNEALPLRLLVRYGFRPSRGTFFNRKKKKHPKTSATYKVYVASTQTLWVVRWTVFGQPAFVGGKPVSGSWVEHSYYFENRPEIQADWNVVPGMAQLNVLYQKVFGLYEASWQDWFLSLLPIDVVPNVIHKQGTRAVGYWEM